MEDDFYLRFENKFRGSRSLIKKRVEVYLDIIEPVKKAYPDALAVDCGCGRGEWLELLSENGWNAQGVDINTNMIEECTRLGLNAVLGNAIEYVAGLEDKSTGIISGFHIAEHLEFNNLLKLFREAHRALLPGGLLILETPNPENILVASCSFYKDPTHRNPIPSDLMQFIAEDTGFSDSIIIRLNSPEPNNDQSSFASQVAKMFTSYPDYGLIAQKEADPGLKVVIDCFQETEPQQTTNLHTLADIIANYEKRVEEQEMNRQEVVNNLKVHITKQLTHSQWLEKELSHTKAEAKQQTESLNKQIRENEVELAQTQTILKYTNDLIDQKDSYINKIEKQLKNMEEYVSNSDVKLEEVNNKLNEAETRLGQVNIKSSELELRLNEFKKLHADRNLQYNDLNIQLADVIGQIGTKDARIQELESNYKEINKLVEKKDIQILEIQRHLTYNQEVIKGVLQSYSWRLTEPLRLLSKYIKKFFGAILMIYSRLNKSNDSIKKANNNYLEKLNPGNEKKKHSNKLYDENMNAKQSSNELTINQIIDRINNEIAVSKDV